MSAATFWILFLKVDFKFLFPSLCFARVLWVPGRVRPGIFPGEVGCIYKCGGGASYITSACAAGTAAHQKTCLSLSAAAEGDVRNLRAAGCPCSAELVPGGLYHSLQNRWPLPRQKSRGQVPQPWSQFSLFLTVGWS